MTISKRKKEHIDICLKSPVDREDHFFDHISLPHNAFPEIDFKDIDTRTSFLGKNISAPILISPMTGWTKETQKINENLVYAAEKCSIPLGVGSQRIFLEDEKTLSNVRSRIITKNIPMIANIGAVQLNYGFSFRECESIVENIKADALCLHLNPLQEAIQPEGDVNFSGLFKKIELLVQNLTVPVIVKEVGSGISSEVAKKLKEIGVSIIDVSGRGGTSWALIEGERRKDHKNLGDIFKDWGIPTPIAIKECVAIPGVTVIASGGIRSGLDIVKALSLGASYAGLGLPFLKAADKSREAVVQLIEDLIYEIKVAMFCMGKKNIDELKEVEIDY